MKNKKEPKFRWGLCVIACLAALFNRGCGPEQPSERVDVHGWRVRLWQIPNQTDARLPDAWAVSTDTQGRDIYGVAHGFDFRLLDVLNEPLEKEGIYVKVEVVDHWSPLYNRDLWDQTTPNGKKYGFLRVFPDAGSGVYDGVLYGVTNDTGSFAVFPGLGDPKRTFNPAAPLDPDYEWPGPGDSYSDCVDTVVQLKITIPGKRPPVEPIYVWCNYLRVQYQNFWWPEGQGVYNRSKQDIGQKSRPSSMIPSPDPNTVERPSGIFDLSLYKSPGPKLTPSKYPRVPSGTKRSATAYVTPSGVTLDALDLTQLRWDPDIGWAYFLLEPGQGLPGNWIAEPNDPNCITNTLSATYPYAFWADITLPEPFYGDTATTTVILRAVDRVNVVQSKIPLTVTLVAKSPDNLSLTFLSDWFVVSVDPNFHGYYQDKWQNPYTVLYFPEQTHPDLAAPDIFGDFNVDDRVDFYDFALFAVHWLDSVHDPNTGYDAMYEDPNTWDGEISILELKTFAEHWLR